MSKNNVHGQISGKFNRHRAPRMVPPDRWDNFRPKCLGSPGDRVKDRQQKSKNLDSRTVARVGGPGLKDLVSLKYSLEFSNEL
tara:strand:- start:308 stop:556 length:249 start_codon:yes stop_codon:yes gene_type:complete